MRKVPGVLIGLLQAATMLTPVNATSLCGGHSGVTLWEDIWYFGPKITFCTVDAQHLVSILDLTPYGWNDRVSSYEFFNSAGVRTFRIWSASRFGGVAITSTSDAAIHDVGDYWVGHPGFGDGFNDQASSLEIY